MTKLAQNFTVYEGDDKDLVVTVTDADGDAVNITGASISWVMSRDGTAVLSKSSASSAEIELTSPSTGVFKIHIDPADTADLSGLYDHEAVMTDSSGNVSTIFRGTANIKPDLV